MAQEIIKKPTGYSIYNKDVKKRTIHSYLSDEEFYPKLPLPKSIQNTIVGNGFIY